LWQPVGAARVAEPSPDEVSPPPPEPEDAALARAERRRGERRPLPEASCLVPWRRLRRRVEPIIQRRVPTHRIDPAAWVDAASRAVIPSRLPMVTRSALPRRLFLWLDRGPAMSVLWPDQRELTGRLVTAIGEAHVHVRQLWAGPTGPMRDHGDAALARQDALGPGDAVLVLSDLGALAAGEPDGAWLDTGRRLRRRGAVTALLAPALEGRAPAGWLVAAWQTGPVSPPASRRARAERLVSMLAPAFWVERGLLRDIRRAVSADLDLVAEVDAWRSARLRPVGPGIRAIAHEHLRAAQDEFARLPEPTRELVYAHVRRWHHGTRPPELAAEETVVARALGVPGISHDALDDAHAFFADLRRELADRGLDSDLGRGMRPWFEAFAHRLPDAAGSRELVALWLDLFGTAAVEKPAWVRVQEARERLPPAERRLWVLQHHHHLELVPVGTEMPRRSWVAEITLARPVVDVVMDGVTRPVSLDDDGRALVSLPELRDVHAAVVGDDVTCPEWAEAAGRDDYGVWASVRVGSVVFRMRWIEPGTATIGSPPGEVGRAADQPEVGRANYESERDVTFDEGYWMADTPTTQGLWREVMGSAPSEFEGAEHPVERVSWDEVQRFLRRLADRVPGLDPVLPTEEAWEYACRASTRTATYGGDLEHEGAQAVVLDEIAWYGANSGRRTHRVATKAPNAWGLYDMLGNVHEWTSSEEGSRRVLRGGAWSSDAPTVRAARSLVLSPAYGDAHIGFRLSRVQAAAPPARVAVRTDRTVLTLEAMPRPTWATAFGRDRFGLWADDVIAGVRLRLRWIPPGRFLMGSPQDEPGREDHEGPRHEVLLTQGYWLAEVACTQALWTAVNGPPENPSEFKSPNRPVDHVSWYEARTFAEDALAKRGHAGYGLPTEAQWEHACRAGSAEATYGGAMHILGENNAPVLDDLAWYGGNSGVGWDLPAVRGWDSAEWPDKQYPHKRAGAREVAQKTPNAWGLYDMLGNVWEWCADGWRPYTADRVEDPVGPKDMGSDGGGILRGGAWNYDAQSVRAAYRFAGAPVSRSASLGFRLARSQARQTSGPAQRSQRSAVAGGASGANVGGAPADAEASRFERAAREAQGWVGSARGSKPKKRSP
jgi:formylglycine-generating enzyme required for sulfatase activity